MPDILPTLMNPFLLAFILCSILAPGLGEDILPHVTPVRPRG